MKTASAARWMIGVWAALSVVGCSDDGAKQAEPWGLNDPRSGQDMVQDMAAPDMAVEPDMFVGPDMSAPLCAECVFGVEVGRLDAPRSAQESGIGPFIGGDRLVWRGDVVGPDGAQRGQAINTQRPGEAPRRVVFEPGAQITLLGAHGDNLLYWSQREGRSRLIARFGAREVVLDELSGPILAELGGFDGAATHMIGPERAAMVVVRSGADPRQTLVFAGPNGRVGRYELPPGAFTAPFVRGQDVVLGAAIEGDPSAQTILWVREPGQVPRKVGTRPGASQSSPVVVGQDALWIRDGAVVRGDLMATREEVVLPGPCGPLDADALHAVVACGTDFMPGNLPGQATVLYMIDPGQAPQLIYKTHGGRHIIAPRVSGDRVAWLEYPQEQTFCSTPTEASGEVMVLAWDVAQARIKAGPQALGPAIAAPCFCCNAYWPPFALSFAGDLLTWRYDMLPGGQERGDLGLGWARLGGLRCRDVACDTKLP
jgi:hypothetical protein